MLNKHGLKMTDIKQAAALTRDLTGYYSGHYVQLSYDLSNGAVITNAHYSLGQNSWVRHASPDVIAIGNISTPKTMQQIADMIYDRVLMMQTIEAI